MRHQRIVQHSLTIGGLAIATGCTTRPTEPRRLDPIPLRQAIELVNSNAAKAGGTIRAVGSVDGELTLPNGRRRSYSLDGVLFFLSPHFVRFDLKKLGDRQFLFGSNAEQFWFFDREEKSFVCGRHEEPADVPEDLPIRPDQIVDALGLRMLGADESGASAHMVQRVTDDYQQILFLTPGANDRITVEKEYWLDRLSPRLVRHVVFRDELGVTELESTLSEYRETSPGGPLLPHVMIANWPKKQTRMRFRVNRWAVMPDVNANGPQFAPPPECQQGRLNSP